MFSRIITLMPHADDTPDDDLMPGIRIVPSRPMANIAAISASRELLKHYVR